MRKITYSLRIGLIGSLNSGKEIFINFLKKRENNNSFLIKNHKDFAEYIEFFIIFKGIPIKIKLSSAIDLSQALHNFKGIENFDVLIFTINMHDYNSIKEFNKENIEEFYRNSYFHGISILTGVETDFSPIYQKYELELVNKAKELKTLYCFKVKKEIQDLLEVFNKILEDFIFKIQYSNPEIFEQAKIYGEELLKKPIDKKAI